MATVDDPITYRDAMTELQEIVTRLRDTVDVDVDDLVKDVARAKKLIDFCGSKIKKADVAIKTIVADLRAEDIQEVPDFPEPALTAPPANIENDIIPF